MHYNVTENKLESTIADAKLSRRELLAGAVAGAASTVAGLAGAQSFDFKPNQRYPDASANSLR